MTAAHLMFASLIFAIGGASQTPAPVRPAACAPPAVAPCRQPVHASPAPPRSSDRRIVYPLQ